MLLSICLPAAGNGDGNFALSLNGDLKVLKSLDREEIPVYSIIIKASSNRSWTPPRGQRAARTKALDPTHDPSLLEVRIELEDINDQTPHFIKAEYTAGDVHSSSVHVYRYWSVLNHPLPLSACFRSCSKCQSGLRLDQGHGDRQ